MNLQVRSGYFQGIQWVNWKLQFVPPLTVFICVETAQKKTKAQMCLCSFYFLKGTHFSTFIFHYYNKKKKKTLCEMASSYFVYMLIIMLTSSVSVLLHLQLLFHLLFVCFFFLNKIITAG